MKIYRIKTSLSWFIILCEISLTLQFISNKNIYVLLISETKTDYSIPLVQLHLKCYANPYRLDKNANGCGILLYKKEDIPPTLLSSDLSTEAFFVEMILKRKIWLLCTSYNPKKSLIANHLHCIDRNLESQLRQYENVVLMGDFNVEPNHATMEKFF